MIEHLKSDRHTLVLIKNMAMTEADVARGPELTAWLALYAAAADVLLLSSVTGLSEEDAREVADLERSMAEVIGAH